MLVSKVAALIVDLTFCISSGRLVVVVVVVVD